MTAKLYIGVFMLLAGTLYSCQKDEEVNKLDADYHVMTDYDPETDFSQFQSYYLADSVLFIGKDEKPQYLDSLQAGPILNACHHNMQERGYSRAASKENADLGLQMTYIASTYHFVGYTASPYWWRGFSGYWSPFYWENRVWRSQPARWRKIPKTYTNTQRNTKGGLKNPKSLETWLSGRYPTEKFSG